MIEVISYKGKMIGEICEAMVQKGKNYASPLWLKEFINKGGVGMGLLGRVVF
ncbi:hypothetical protein KEH51_10605 [[Brevibacterium] frigoritolerans]|uniref:Uncharacterized protein n=1 Tax=Peribacillus frigoritolerans TaxID=450367 RepID=A0A941FH67_9BACI|nr:hypothetical protein [Peribacillus frigoritolerans]